MTRDIGKYKHLWQYLRPYWHLELVTFFIMAIIVGLSLALPRAIQYMIDSLIPNMIGQSAGARDFTPIIIFGLVLVGIYLGNVLFSWLRDYLAGYIGANIICNMRSEMFLHLERLSLKFHQDHQVGEIMSRLLSDVSRIQSLLSETLLMFLTNILMLVGILAYLLHTNWLLTLIAVIPVPLTVLASDRYGKRINSIITTLQETMADLSARVQERLLGVKTVKAFGQEAAEGKRLNETLTGIFQLSVKNSVAMSLASNLVQFINMIGPIVVLAWGVYLVAAGHMKLGELIAFYILLTYLYSPIQGLAQTNIQVQSAMASVDRVFEYLDIPPAVVESLSPVTIEQVSGEIRLNKVNFGYGNSSFRLDGLSLTIRPKEKVAIVGPSGSGKTTIISLIMRFFDPESGTILLDGVDVRELSFATLRKHVALVDQDPLLFKGTVFENIAYGRPEASLDDVMAAARIAGIHDFVASLPDGYQAQIGERGVTVSGGERQRLCLARAVLVNPSVLILDEATSALDSNSEQLIQESLKRILAEKTAIIIAHRLSTIQHVDRIVALADGRIVDEGNHEELSGRCPMYRELAQKQFLL
jgi:ABC-type multidrug transport system fused ATPase/permease subunit